ncbi:hypothetical protein N431DRAFT_489193 [Stipitochalara longipes BDJ]|nr:hypothetical protein N431DRAFT_489193 [Stipitochalara longipes BDJ]
MGFQRSPRTPRSTGNRSNAPSPEQEKPGAPPSSNDSDGSSWDTISEEDVDDPNYAGDSIIQADRHTQFSDLPPEIRRMIWANAAGYDANEPRIIQVQIHHDQTQRVHRLFSIPAFRIESPVGPYQATNRQTIFNRESRDLYSARFPHQLRFNRLQVRVAGELVEYRDHLGQRIDFDANRDIILMDAFTMECLNFARGQLRSLVGFNQIRHLATTLDDNNIRGIQNFLRHRNGALSNVVDIIQVSDADIDSRDREEHVLFMEEMLGRDLDENENNGVENFFSSVLSQEEFEEQYPWLVNPSIEDVLILNPNVGRLVEVEEVDTSPSNDAGALGNAQ